MTTDTAANSGPLRLTSSDGVDLEAELSIPETAQSIAVLAHPHPQGGGSMHAGVIDSLFRQLPDRGVGVLRFNFRSVGGSGGIHDEGRAERLDLQAAVAEAVGRCGNRPVFVAGWSFGADVSTAVVDEDLAGWFLIAPPLRIVDAADMVAAADPRPKQIAVPEHDQFNPPDKLAVTVADWVNTTHDTIGGSDHFLGGHDRFVIDAVLSFAHNLTS